MARPRKEHDLIPLFTREANIKRRLRRHMKTSGFMKDEEGHLQPPYLTKDAIRIMHSEQRPHGSRMSVDSLSVGGRF